MSFLQFEPIQLVDGGKQSRSFTFIDDGVDALLRIIENKNGARFPRQIFNIGNPANDVNVAKLAKLIIIKEFKRFPDHYREYAAEAKVVVVSSRQVLRKVLSGHPEAVPSIENIRKQLGWTPKVDLQTAIRRTLDYHLARTTTTSLE